MQLKLPEQIIKLYKQFQTHNFAIYLVGGSVRNMLLNKPVEDWDFTTSATPEEILRLFPGSFYDNKFGTVGIPIKISHSKLARESISTNLNPQDPSMRSDTTEPNLDDKLIVEVTTFRTEQNYTDNRHPENVTWGKTIAEDLERRDFTINAIALELTFSDLGFKTKLIDPYAGQKDLEAKIIRAVGDPNQRFKEDALRLLRAIRLSTQLSFTIEEQTWQAIIHDAMLLNLISADRIRNELLKILASTFPYEGIMLLKDTHLLEHILPELLIGIGISQSRPGRHHTTDVFTHNVLSLKFCPAQDPLVRFATLLHDIGKPKVQSLDEQGLVTFYNHEVAGARIAYAICQRLNFSKKDREKIVKLIRWHMFTVDEIITDAAIRRFIRRVGVENVADMLDLRIGDRLGGGTQTAESWRLKLFKQRVATELGPKPFSINDLAIDGNDLMRELKLKPGPKIGEILQKLFLEVDEDLSLNTKEYLLERIKKPDLL